MNDTNDTKNNSIKPHPILDKVFKETERKLEQQAFEEFYQSAKEVFGYNMRNHRMVNGVFMDSLSRITDLSIAQLEEYQAGTCEFNFEEVCRITCAIGIDLEEVFRR